MNARTFRQTSETFAEDDDEGKVDASELVEDMSGINKAMEQIWSFQSDPTTSKSEHWGETCIIQPAVQPQPIPLCKRMDKLERLQQELAEKQVNHPEEQETDF